MLLLDITLGRRRTYVCRMYTKTRELRIAPMLRGMVRWYGELVVKLIVIILSPKNS